MHIHKLFLRHFNVCAAALVLIGANASWAGDIDFGKDIYPILKESCLGCHSKAYIDADSGKLKKPKGGLRLDTPEWIQKGYEDDDGIQQFVIVAGDPLKSPFYTLTTLDPDDEDIMPAKGDTLTITQQALIRDWIAQGAKFGNFVAPEYVNPKAKP